MCRMLFIPDLNQSLLLSDPWPSSCGRWAPHLSSLPAGQWCWPVWFQSQQSPPSAAETSPLNHPGEHPTPSGSLGMLSGTAQSKQRAQRWCVRWWLYGKKSIRQVNLKYLNTSYYVASISWSWNMSLLIFPNIICNEPWFLNWIPSILFFLRKSQNLIWGIFQHGTASCCKCCTHSTFSFAVLLR